MSGCVSYNAVEDFVDRNVANGRAGHRAFIDPQTSLTYRELQAATCKMANVLANLGITPGTRIGVLMRDSVDFPCVYWGAIRAGVIPVCLNTLLTPGQYEYLLADSGVEALFVTDDLVTALEPVLAGLEGLRHVVVAGKALAQYPALNDLMAAASDTFETVMSQPDAPCFWLYSSGSTGDPKGVIHKQSSLMYVARHFGRKVLGITAEDVCFSAAKLFFAYAQGGAMAIPMSVGATTVLLPARPTPESILAMFKRFNPSVFFGVPTLYASLLASPDCHRENLPVRLRLCVSAGEALPRDVGRAWRQRTGLDIVDGVGSTEMLNAFLSNRPGDVRLGVSGREFDGYRLRLVREDGCEAGDNEIGELLVNGGSAALGYWNKPDKTRSTFVNGWVHSGDKYYRDSDGYYHYCGRTNDMFKVSGRWVSPFEIEDALVLHPAVREAAVVACADDKGLIKPKAFVVLNSPGPTEGLYEALKEHVKSSAGVWKYPRWIVFTDALPKTATGKIQRYKLRK